MTTFFLPFPGGGQGGGVDRRGHGGSEGTYGRDSRSRAPGRVWVARLSGRALFLRNERRGRLQDVSVAAEELLARLTEIRVKDPEAVQKALAKRRRRSLLERDSLFLVAADHTARGVLKVGDDPMAMSDRGELLRRLLTALGRPGVDGLLATADIVEDLALLGALDDKVVFGSM